MPQIAVFSSLISTSFGPGTGTGTSSIQIPLAASRFTRARIVCAGRGRVTVSDMLGACDARRAMECELYGRAPETPVGLRRPPRCRYGRRPLHGNPMRRRLLATALSLSIAPVVASEGMWMPSQLPEIAPQLKAAGFEGDPAALADLTRPPLSAVVKVGGATGASYRTTASC